MKRENECRCLNCLILGQQALLFLTSYIELELEHAVFAPLLAPIPNFIQIGQKTQLEIFTFGRFWLVGLVGRKMVVGILNSFYVVFAPLLTPIPNFIQIG